MMPPIVLIRVLRPSQWLKNLMLFFPPFLGGTLFISGVMAKGMVPFFAFCLASSSAYILNDLYDVKRDALHPQKKRRPIPAGEISKFTAVALVFLMAAGAFILGFRVSAKFSIFLGVYLIVSGSYSLKLKNIPIADIFSISAGFIIRLMAGGDAFGIAISEWLFLTVFLLSMFLSTGKRLGEKLVLGEEAGNHRKSLTSYPPGFLEGTLHMTGATVLVTYTLYSIPHFPLVYTVPLCAYGLLRYMLRVKSGVGGDPTESLIRDLPLFFIGLIWVVSVGWSIYK